MSNLKLVYLKDFYPTAPIPQLYQVEEEKLNNIIGKTINVEYRMLNKQTYIRYPSFFGPALSRVWINEKLLKQIGNPDLYKLQKFVTEKGDHSLNESFPGAYYIVEELNYPLKQYPWFLTNGETVIGIR